VTELVNRRAHQGRFSSASRRRTVSFGWLAAAGEKTSNLNDVETHPGPAIYELASRRPSGNWD